MANISQYHSQERENIWWLVCAISSFRKDATREKKTKRHHANRATRKDYKIKVSHGFFSHEVFSSLSFRVAGFVFSHGVYVCPMGIWCQNDVVLTSMRRHHVASTSIRRQSGTKCPLGGIAEVTQVSLDSHLAGPRSAIGRAPDS